MREEKAMVGLREADIKKAHEKHVDLSVFGIRMGEAFDAPDCELENVDPLASAFHRIGEASRGDGLTIGDPEPWGNVTCQPQGGGAKMALGHFRNNSLNLPGASVLVAQVPRDKCPQWLRAGRYNCSLSVTVKDHYVVRVAFPAGNLDSEDVIEKSLTKKYGVPSKPGDETTCRARAAGVVTYKAREHVWTVPGIRISYNPLGWTCPAQNEVGRGWVSVQLAGFAQLREDIAKKREAAEPGM